MPCRCAPDERTLASNTGGVCLLPALPGSGEFAGPIVSPYSERPTIKFSAT